MMKRIIACLLASAIAVTLAGCNSSNELSRIAIVMGLGIDGSGDNLNVTIQVAKPGEMKFSESGGDNAYINVSCSGETLQLCMRQFERMLSRELYTKQLELILISEDTSRQGLESVMEYFMRSSDIRISVPMIIVEGSASDMLNIDLKLQKLPVTRLAGIIDTQFSGTLETALERTPMERFLGESQTYMAATVPLFGFTETDDVEVKGASVFRDMRMIGTLDKDEVRMMLMVKGTYQSGVESVHFSDGSVMTFRMISVRTKLTPSFDGEMFTVNVGIYVEFMLSEEPRSVAQYSEAYRLESEKLVNELLTQKIVAAVDKSCELNSDVFGFGNAIWRKFPRDSKDLLNNWLEEYRNINISVTVSSVMISTGSTVKSLQE